MKNGIELTEGQYKTLVLGTVFNTLTKEDMDVSLDNAKKHGYIKKSTLEEARELACEAMEVGENIEYTDKYRRMKDAMLKYEQYAKEIEAQND